jgi:hypothetical protein
MNNHQQEQIVMEAMRLAKDLAEKCSKWLHTATDRRYDNAALELGLAADAMYTVLHTNGDIMGSDTGKPSFDLFQPDPEFQSDMQSLWDLPEPDFREIRRLKNE